MRILEPKTKKFRKVGKSKYIAIKDVLGAMPVNTDDEYQVEYFKDKVVITRIK